MANDTSPTSEQASALSARVFALVLACPIGRVTTYGWLAKAVGYPRGARMIGCTIMV
jgi:alkylated DNA nucleotide flippase Atl1